MRSKVSHREPAADDAAFTLIEVLIVIIIIGILAAIAIPVFLSQRSKSYDAASKSDLRNLAAFEEIYLTDYNTYAKASTVQASEPKLSVSQGVTLSVVRFSGQNGYCLSASHTGTSQVWYYDSQAGGIQPRTATDCPATTTGTAGDSLTGP